MKGTSKDLLNVNFFGKKRQKLRVFLSKKICEILRRKLSDMIIPVLNMDVTPAVQLMIVISYIALVYGLSVEIIGYHPFGRTIKPKVVNVKIENPATESAAKQRKTISREGRFLSIKNVREYFEEKRK